MVNGYHYAADVMFHPLTANACICKVDRKVIACIPCIDHPFKIKINLGWFSFFEEAGLVRDTWNRSYRTGRFDGLFQYLDDSILDDT